MAQVACTALGLNHPILKGRVFDMCILDEAGQITLPVALGPVLRSRSGLCVQCSFNQYQLHLVAWDPEASCAIPKSADVS